MRVQLRPNEVGTLAIQVYRQRTNVAMMVTACSVSDHSGQAQHSDRSRTRRNQSSSPGNARVQPVEATSPAIGSSFPFVAIDFPGAVHPAKTAATQNNSTRQEQFAIFIQVG
jgi:hypothetical protein